MCPYDATEAFNDTREQLDKQPNDNEHADHEATTREAGQPDIADISFHTDTTYIQSTSCAVVHLKYTHTY